MCSKGDTSKHLCLLANKKYKDLQPVGVQNITALLPGKIMFEISREFWRIYWISSQSTNLAVTCCSLGKAIALAKPVMFYRKVKSTCQS